MFRFCEKLYVKKQNIELKIKPQNMEKSTNENVKGCFKHVYCPEDVARTNK